MHQGTVSHPDLLRARLIDSTAIDVALAGAHARKDAVGAKNHIRAHFWCREARKGDVARLDTLARRRRLLCAGCTEATNGGGRQPARDRAIFSI